MLLRPRGTRRCGTDARGSVFCVLSSAFCVPNLYQLMRLRSELTVAILPPHLQRLDAEGCRHRVGEGGPLGSSAAEAEGAVQAWGGVERHKAKSLDVV